VPIVLIVIGFVLLIGGSELLVRGASALALRLGLTPLVVGLTVVAVGTSSPELAVSIKASLGGSGGVAVGNIVGSNICNIGLILGVAALIFPLSVERKVIRREIPILLAASALFLLFASNKTLTRIEGIISITAVIGYMVFLVIESRRSSRSEKELSAAAVPASRLPLWSCLLFIAAGLAALIFGSRFVVEGAVVIAGRAGMPEAVIGLTIVAIGTSLPELATSAVAAAKREADIAVGNVIGSNLFNLLLIGGTAATLRPVETAQLHPVDFGVMLVLSIILLPFLRTGFKLSRLEGAVLAAGYLVYIGYLVFFPLQ
jgi:cation:H+ antiporter